jgi:hypothetical protein
VHLECEPGWLRLLPPPDLERDWHIPRQIALTKRAQRLAAAARWRASSGCDLRAVV